jgi:hypothetical protein
MILFAYCERAIPISSNPEDPSAETVPESAVADSVKLGDKWPVELVVMAESKSCREQYRTP